MTFCFFRVLCRFLLALVASLTWVCFVWPLPDWARLTLRSSWWESSSISPKFILLACLCMSISPTAFLHLLAPPASPPLPLPMQQSWGWLHQGRLLPLVKLVLCLLLQLIPHLPIMALMEAVHPGLQCAGAARCCCGGWSWCGAGRRWAVSGAGPSAGDVAGRQLGQEWKWWRWGSNLCSRVY